MSHAVTAKVVLQSKLETGTGNDRQVAVCFAANYAAGQNQSWARYTPGLKLDMTLKGEVADQFDIGQGYTLTFTKDEPPVAESEPATEDKQD